MSLFTIPSAGTPLLQSSAAERQALAGQLAADWARDAQAVAAQAATALAVQGTDWLVLTLGEALQRRGWQVATAESCTGGGIATALTAVAGSSAWVEGGWVTYSNAAKTHLLGVPADTIATHGAVSLPVVRAMAEGARAGLAVSCAVAVSGVAGPGGGSPAKPVGTVCLAWATTAGVQAQQLHFPGDRAAVRHGTIWVALLGLLQAASGHSA